MNGEANGETTPAQTARAAAPLTEAQSLAWADDWKQRTGRRPRVLCGRIPGGLGDTWLRVNAAQHRGLRGLPGHSSLARLLVEQRGARSSGYQPPLSDTQTSLPVPEAGQPPIALQHLSMMT